MSDCLLQQAVRHAKDVEVIPLQVFEGDKIKSVVSLVTQVRALMRQLAAINTKLLESSKILFTIVSPEARTIPW